MTAGGVKLRAAASAGGGGSGTEIGALDAAAGAFAELSTAVAAPAVAPAGWAAAGLAGAGAGALGAARAGGGGSTGAGIGTARASSVRSFTSRDDCPVRRKDASAPRFAAGTVPATVRTEPSRSREPLRTS